MYFHPEKKLCYLAHPRTASRATRDALLDQAGFGTSGPKEGKEYTEFYTGEMRDAVAAEFHEEISELGYTYGD